MSVPEDERQFYDAAAAEQAQADLQDDVPKPELSDDQVRYLSLVSLQARQTVDRCPDLLRHLERSARTGTPPGTSVSASEVALWRAGYEDCLATIQTAADWPGPEDNEDGR